MYVFYIRKVAQKPYIAIEKSNSLTNVYVGVNTRKSLFILLFLTRHANKYCNVHKFLCFFISVNFYSYGNFFSLAFLFRFFLWSLAFTCYFCKEDNHESLIFNILNVFLNIFYNKFNY